MEKIWVREREVDYEQLIWTVVLDMYGVEILGFDITFRFFDCLTKHH